MQQGQYKYFFPVWVQKHLLVKDIYYSLYFVLQFVNFYNIFNDKFHSWRCIKVSYVHWNRNCIVFLKNVLTEKQEKIQIIHIVLWIKHDYWSLICWRVILQLGWTSRGVRVVLSLPHLFAVDGRSLFNGSSFDDRVCFVKWCGLFDFSLFSCLGLHILRENKPVFFV